MVTAIVGSSFGDEGKGKITDVLATKADICVRFQGGANAGHTIINEYGRFALHTIPSGIFNKNTMNIIGNGVALNVNVLMKEISELKEKNIPFNLMISNRCQIVMSYHVLFDVLEEQRLGKNSFGSTKSGIAPFYSDKYSKIGFQVSELFDTKEYIIDKINRVLEIKNVLLENLYHHEKLNPIAIYNELMDYKEKISEYVADTSLYLQNSLDKNILVEGQLGTLKDPDFGIYPMTTSSSPLAGYATVGAGIPPWSIKKIIAVCKAYSSAVGAGEFVSEIFGNEAEELRKRGGDKGEYGATTGRPRRVGWFDCVSARYGCKMQGATDIAFTVVDALSYLDEIPVCVAYEIDGKIVKDFPPTYELKKAKPVYKILDGWKCDIKGIKNYFDLPENCRKYIAFIEQEIGIPITFVSNGPARENIIEKI